MSPASHDPHSAHVVQGSRTQDIGLSAPALPSSLLLLVTRLGGGWGTTDTLRLILSSSVLHRHPWQFRGKYGFSPLTLERVLDLPHPLWSWLVGLYKFYEIKQRDSSLEEPRRGLLPAQLRWVETIERNLEFPFTTVVLWYCGAIIEIINHEINSVVLYWSPVWLRVWGESTGLAG